MYRVTISTITERGVLPQFFNVFAHKCLADDYVKMYRSLAAKAGVMIRVDRESVNV